MQKQKLLWIAGLSIIGGLIVALFPDLAYGLQTGSPGSNIDVQSSNNAIKTFKNLYLGTWETRASLVGASLFGGLATIQLIFLGYRYMGDGVLSEAKSMKREGIIILFYFILLSGSMYLDHIVNGLVQIGSFIADKDTGFSEADILVVGLKASMNFVSEIIPAFKELEWWEIVLGSREILMDSIRGVFFGLLFQIGFIIIAVQYSFITLEAFIMTALAPLPLAFGALKQTRGIADGYLEYLFRLGFKLLFFLIIFTVAELLVEGWGKHLIRDQSYAGETYPMGDMVKACSILALMIALLAKLPSKFAQSLTSKMDISLENIF